MKTSIRRFWAKSSGASGSMYLYGDVGGWYDGINAKAIADLVKEFTDAGVNALSCYVNSYGGDVFEGFAIYNVLRRFPGSVTMCVDGIAASAASIICMAGKSIAMSSAGMMMIHEARTYGGGTADELEDAAVRLEKINDSMAAVYAERSRQPIAAIRTMMADETWFTAAEACTKGFCDTILRSDDDQKSASRAAASLTATAAARKEQFARFAARAGKHRKGSKSMAKKNKVSAFTLYKLGLPPDASDADVMEALDALQERARQADVTKAKLEADARAKAEADEKARRAREGEPDLPTLASKAAGDAGAAERTRADSERRLCDLTGQKTYGEALGVVLSWKNTVGEVEKLQSRIAELEQKGQGATAEALVEQGIREGKITPAQKELWLGIGKKDPDMLKGFLSTASPVVPKKAAIAPEGSKAKVALTAEQQRAAAKMGITDPKALDQLSEQMAEAQALRAGAA